MLNGVFKIVVHGRGQKFNFPGALLTSIETAPICNLHLGDVGSSELVAAQEDFGPTVSLVFLWPGLRLSSIFIT